MSHVLDGCVPWPDDLAASYRAAGYWVGRCLGECPPRWADRYGDRVALVDRNRRLTYRDLDAEVAALAAGFAGHGLGAGDRVVVQLPNTIDFVTVCFALFRLGVVPVFCLPTHRRQEVEYLLRHSSAVAYVVPAGTTGFDHPALAAEMLAAVEHLRLVVVAGASERFASLESLRAGGAAPPDVRTDPGDVAFFLLSGGTTALPKLIPRTHDDYLYQATVTARLCGVTDETVYLAVLPVEFNFPWGCPGIVGVLDRGGTVVLAADPSPQTGLPLVEAERVTMTSVVPTIAHLWVDAVPHAGADLSSLRLVQVGSAKLHRELAERVRDVLDCELQQVFGMAEGLLTFTRRDDDAETVLATQGRPVSPGDEIRVVDERGAPVRPGEIGELTTRGPYTLRGYFRAPERNATAFTEDGFYRSGDLVRLTADGNMVVEGRIKEVIIRGGDKVSATEVEGLLVDHPGVEQAAVVPVPDTVLGERTCAFIRSADSPAPTRAQLRRFLLDAGVAEFKVPDRVAVLGTFPLTGLNKVDKNELTRMAGELTDRVDAR